ncbi:MAG: hypothetical protein M3Z65_05860 [Chloroflexota bacterium]|nr:hypothetical protein [Chloroflexota bacterium]
MIDRRRLVVIVAISVALLGTIWAFNVFDVRAKSPLATVASAFDAPPAYPGYRWSRDGREVGEFELTSIAGPAHCGWQSATVLFLSWPLGTIATSGDQTRQYVRDPQGVFRGSFRERLEKHATLPADARATGYRLGPIELFLAPGGADDAVYLVAPGGTERWPRADPMQLCS